MERYSNLFLILLILIPVFIEGRGCNPFLKQDQWNPHCNRYRWSSVASVLPVIQNSIFFFSSALTAASVYHVLEGGRIGKYEGKTQEEILGVSPDEATVEDLAKLSKWQYMQLFYASPEVSFGSQKIEGEWDAKILPIGIVHPITSFITANLMGDGKWVGKGVYWNKPSYNIFSAKEREQRMRNFNCQKQPSFYDGKQTLVFDYSDECEFPLNGMKDEVRFLNSNLLFGLGSLALFGGALNSAAFVLVGPPKYSNSD